MAGKLALQAASAIMRDGHAFDYFRPRPATGQVLTQDGSSQRSTEITTGLITVYTEGDCWVTFGGSTVTCVSDGTELFMSAGERITFALKGAGYLATIGTAADKVYISELE